MTLETLGYEGCIAMKAVTLVTLGTLAILMRGVVTLVTHVTLVDKKVGNKI